MATDPSEARSAACAMIDVRAVADRLGISTKAVRGLIGRGELPAYKVAGRIRVDLVDLDLYLAGARVRPVERRLGRPPVPLPTGTAGGLRDFFRNSDAAV
jgi:excisionase family DNA binding protein